MKEEDKELLLKDLCARLLYGVICHANEINLDGELLFINKLYSTVALYNDNATGKFDTCPIVDVKPYLRPISSMTEEEIKEFALLQTDFYVDKVLYRIPATNMVDWLNKHQFDYRGLIPKGLALEAPKNMYKFD